MSTETSSSEKNALDAAIAEWFQAIKEGATPDSQEFLNRYPEIRTELQVFFQNFTIIQSRISDAQAPQRGNSGSSPESRPASSSPQSIVTAVSLGNTDVSAGSVTSNALYRELKLLNKGGLGDLYRAYDESLNRETAVKRVNDRAASEPALLTQFRIEAEITGRLDHPGVVPVYGYGEDAEHRPFYVMRLINGRELSAAIREYHVMRNAHPSSPETRRLLLTLLARDLTSWMRDDELLVAPDRWYHRVARLARRHRGIAISAGVALLAISVAGAWMIRETDRFRYSKQIEEEKRRFIEGQNAIVEKTLDTSLKTLEDLCRPLANGETHNLSVLEPAMNRINDFAIDYLKDYEALPTMALHTGRVYQLRATVSRVLSSDTNEVLRYYQQAEETYEQQLASTKPAANTAELQRRLLDVKLNKSLVHIQREEYVLAELLLKQARDTAETLRLLNRDDSQLEREQAEIFHLLGQVYLSREADDQGYAKALVESESSFDESVHLLKKLMLRETDETGKSHLERDLARSYGYLGDLHLAQGYISKAERRYNDSQDLRRKLYESNRQDEEFRFQYARGLGNFGMLERNYGGHLDLAIKHLEKTVDLQMNLTKEFPNIKIYALDLAYYQNCLAEVLLWQAIDHPDMAAEYLARARIAVATAEQHLQNDPDSKDDLAWSLVTRASIALLGNEVSEATNLASQAEDLMLRGDGSIKLSRSKQVTLALAASLQGNVQAAYQALKDAVDRGENTPVRFEKHRGAGLKYLDTDPQFGPLYRDLCQKVRETIKE